MPSVNHLGSSNGGGKKKFAMVLVRGVLIGVGFGIGKYLHADRLANLMEMAKKETAD